MLAQLFWRSEARAELSLLLVTQAFSIGSFKHSALLCFAD